MICFPNAKINLGLNIVNKRDDGYHNIETIFYPIPIQDALEIVESEKETFTQTGIPIEQPSENNLVIRALNKLKERYPIRPFSIYLQKQIPFGAGLGGGSSDAAFMLKLLNSCCNLNLPTEELESIASEIGADCPFFINNTPVFATGIGNQFTPIDLSLSGYYLCLVKPEIHISTPKAYSMVIPAQPQTTLTTLIKRPIEEWKEIVVNDFEGSVFTQFPRIRTIKEMLYDQGALYASMSGSGSSVYGIFKDKTNLKKLFPDCYVWEGKL